MPERVTATLKALDLLERLQARHGDLIVHLSGGCCDGSSPMCLRAADLPASPHDVQLGALAGAPVVIDSDQDRRWQRPSFHLDVATGEAGGSPSRRWRACTSPSVPHPLTPAVSRRLSPGRRGPGRPRCGRARTRQSRGAPG